MSKLERTAMIVASTLLPVAARAHSGPHRESLELSLRHAFTEPEHLLTMTWIGSWCAMAICVVFWFKPWQKYSWVRFDPLGAAVAGHIRRVDLAGDRDALGPTQNGRSTYIEST